MFNIGLYVGGAVIAVIIIVGIVFTAKRNKEIEQNGIEADAVVSRVKEVENTDADSAATSTTYTFFVTYRTMDGQTVEAKLASGKSFDNHIGKSWYSDLHEGSNVRIKYIPEKPKYVIRIS